MIQEIITYIIVLAAVVFAVAKLVKRFWSSSAGTKKGASSAPSHHNCSDCSTDCALRDLPRPIIEASKDDCHPSPPAI